MPNKVDWLINWLIDRLIEKIENATPTNRNRLFPNFSWIFIRKAKKQTNKKLIKRQKNKKLKNKTKNSWKTSHRRVKLSIICDSGITVQHIWDACGRMVFNVTLRSFGALVIFPTMTKFRFSKHYSYSYGYFSTYLFIDVLSDSSHKNYLYKLFLFGFFVLKMFMTLMTMKF